MEWIHQLDTIEKVQRYIYAGNAVVTLHAPGHRHFTYRVVKSRKNSFKYWVSVLSGPDNMEDYRYIGAVEIYMDTPEPHADFTTTPKSTVTNKALSFRWFHRFFTRLQEGYLPDTLEVWRENRCGKCGAPLTDPVSIKCGIGPVCRGDRKRTG